MPRASKIFTGYRALGYVSNHIPLCVRHHQKHNEMFVITCVGKSFHTYNCSKLGIVSVGTSQEQDISCLAVDAYLVFAGNGRIIKAFARKGREETHVYKGHQADVHLLLPFGNHLVSVDMQSNVKVWDIESEEIYLELDMDHRNFKVTSVVHPSTYLNKVVFGSQQGLMQLWNLHSNKLIYTFAGWGEHITVLEQAPAVDVLAVGLADGRILLHNLKYDETVMSFKQDWGPVTGLTFRTDGHAVMASGSPSGHIALWNLEERKLLSQIRQAHDGAVTGMKCLPSQPLMVTSSPDNSIKVWIFDHPDGGGRLLRERSGHSAPPTKVRHHGSNGQNVLSAGQDSTLRSFSTVHDRHNKSLGRASYNKKETKKSGLKLDEHKMPAIVDFASETARESDWDGIVACHRREKLVTTWSYQRSTMGQHKLMHTRFEEGQYKHVSPMCVDITSCGNFAVVGYSSGHVDVYNIQSGIHRGSYGKHTAHKGAVRGVCVDALNQITVTGGADSKVQFWKFKQKNLLETVSIKTQIAKMLLHRESGMLAVSLDDFSINIVDIETRRIVRKFHGHTNTVTDMSFSSDGRWLVTAAMDTTLRTWDLPSGRLLDCALVDSAISSLSLSPTGDFLATTHIDDVGVYLWSNMTLYTHVPLQPLPSDFTPQTLVLPETVTRGPQADFPEEEASDEEEVVSDFKSPDQISAELVTLSLLPNSRWQNLLNLDVIKERNRPKAPPKKPKAAPFFLPTIAGLTPKFAKEQAEGNKEKDSQALGLHMLPLSEFGKLLNTSAETKTYSDVLDHLKELGPSAIDTELRGLSPEGGGSVELMGHFLTFIQHSFKSNQDFELLQSYLGLFLKLHGDIISNNSILTEHLLQVEQCQKLQWEKLQDSFQQTLCLVNYLRTAAL